MGRSHLHLGIGVNDSGSTGVKPEDYYNVRLARGWTSGQRILAVPGRVGVDLSQHLRSAERLHLS
jgi:hypothetical protein